jgi:hypothetical protein
MARAGNAARAIAIFVLTSGCASYGVDGGEKGSSSHAPSAPKPAPGPSKTSGCDPASPFTTAVPLAGTMPAFGARWDAGKKTVVFNTGTGMNVEFRMGTSFEGATSDAFAPIRPPDAGNLTPALVFPSISNDGLFLGAPVTTGCAS